MTTSRASSGTLSALAAIFPLSTNGIGLFVKSELVIDGSLLFDYPEEWNSLDERQYQ
jgi:hypothetical protein